MSTKFTGPVQTGETTGIPTTDTTGTLLATKEMSLDSSNRSQTRSIPNGGRIKNVTVITADGANVTQGLTVTLGDSTTGNKYGTLNAVQASGHYDMTLTGESVSAGSELVAEVTTSVAGSAASWTSGSLTVLVDYVQV